MAGYRCEMEASHMFVCLVGSPRASEREREREREAEMGTVSNGCCFSPVPPSARKPVDELAVLKMSSFSNSSSTARIATISARKTSAIHCKSPERGTVEEESRRGTETLLSAGKMEDYNTAMKRMMRNPYEYHHDLGMNYTLVSDNLIVGSQPQKPEDIDHLKEAEKVAYTLCLQQDRDIEYWGIDFEAIVQRCKELGIRHMRRPARDFDPDSLRGQLPKAVSSLDWAISEGKGRVYIHCTAGLGRAPAVAIAYMFWFCGMDLKTAYNTLTSKRPCGPNKRAIRGATYDLAKNDPWKEPFENLPDHAFSNVADWERRLIQDRVRGLRET